MGSLRVLVYRGPIGLDERDGPKLDILLSIIAMVDANDDDEHGVDAGVGCDDGGIANCTLPPPPRLSTDRARNMRFASVGRIMFICVGLIMALVSPLINVVLYGEFRPDVVTLAGVDDSPIVAPVDSNA